MNCINSQEFSEYLYRRIHENCVSETTLCMNFLTSHEFSEPGISMNLWNSYDFREFVWFWSIHANSENPCELCKFVRILQIRANSNVFKFDYSMQSAHLWCIWTNVLKSQNVPSVTPSTLWGEESLKIEWIPLAWIREFALIHENRIVSYTIWIA